LSQKKKEERSHEEASFSILITRKGGGEKQPSVQEKVAPGTQNLKRKGDLFTTSQRGESSLTWGEKEGVLSLLVGKGVGRKKGMHPDLEGEVLSTKGHLTQKKRRRTFL